MFFAGLIFLAISCGTEESGKTPGRQFDQEKIDSYNGLNQYDYYREMDEYSNPILKFFFELFSFIFKIFNNKIAFVILLIGLGILIYVVIKRGRSGLLKTVVKNDSLDIVTVEDLENTDYQKLLDLALAAGDMRLATRYTFLIALQYLQKNKKIHWHKEKTNHEYLNELNPELKKPFAALVRAYEYVWYGETEINIHIYHRVKEYFNHLKKISL